jgi:hypothetical protein
VNHQVFIALIFIAGGCSGHYRTIDNTHVDFYLRSPAAKSVSIVVSGDGFQKIPASRDRLGTWRVTLNREAEIRYFFLVDGEVHVPECDLRERDDFGAENCVFSP